MSTIFLDVDTQLDFLSPSGVLYVPGAERIVLEKQLGETSIADAERPSWTWPTR